MKNERKREKRKMLDHEITIKFIRKRLYPTPSVKYLGVKSDENLNWYHRINDLAAKLYRTNSLLFKIRDQLDSTKIHFTTLKMKFSIKDFFSKL